MSAGQDENGNGNPASAWVRTAYLLTRDGDRALALVTAGLDTALRPGADPEPGAVRQALIRRWVAEKHSRATAPVVVRLDDGPALTNDDLWTRLAALPHDQQAALVLRHHDGLTVAEVATVLDRENVTELTEVAEAALGKPDPDDLAALLHTHAADAPDSSELPGRLQHRRSRRRRLRVGALAVAAVVLMAAVAVPLARSPRTLAGAGQVIPIAKAARYQNGGTLIGTASLDTAKTKKASVSFTPTAKPIIVATTCTDITAQTSVTGDRKPLFGGSCSGSASLGANGQPLPFPMGKPVTITLSVTSGDGLAQLAVYQKIPLPAYPFPPRPAHLAAPPTNGAGPDQILGASTTVGDNGSATANVVVGANTQLFLGTSAPGQLTISVDQTQVSTVDSWDWKPGGSIVFLTPDDLARHGIKAKAGQTVQIRVRASRFAVPGWVVTVQQ